MVDKASNLEYKVQFIKYETRDGHIEYLVKIVAPNNITFDIRDRYSNMRRFQQDTREALNLRNINGLPQFPKKKAFGNKAQDFLNTRKNGLENFFKLFFAQPEVQKSQ